MCRKTGWFSRCAPRRRPRRSSRRTAREKEARMATIEESECCERFFRPGYNANLLTSWLPSLGGGVVRALERGAQVADVGCGHGSSTILMAQAFPRSAFCGFDDHDPSIAAARRRAADARLAGRGRFETAPASSDAGMGDHLIPMFHCLDDPG